MADFGTTCAHIASNAYQSFGFGLDFANGLFKGASHPNVSELSDSERRFRVAQIWLDALAFGDAPQETLGDDYEISNSDMDNLVEKVKQLEASGSQHNWLSKTRSDISPEKTPQLDFDYAKSVKPRGRTKTGASSDDDDDEVDTADKDG
jgi:hypothetical protein